jgi:hypothetical protein
MYVSLPKVTAEIGKEWQKSPALGPGKQTAKTWFGLGKNLVWFGEKLGLVWGKTWLVWGIERKLAKLSNPTFTYRSSS